MDEDVTLLILVSVGRNIIRSMDKAENCTPENVLIRLMTRRLEAVNDLVHELNAEIEKLKKEKFDG